MATLAGTSFEADVARIRSVLASNNVGASVDSGTLAAMLAAHIEEEERVDLVLLELEDSFGISLTDPSQVECWQALAMASPRPFRAELTPEREIYPPLQIDDDEPEFVQNQDDADTDVALDRETLLLRKEFPTMRYNEIYLFLRAHRDEPQRLPLARDYFEQERKRLEAEMELSPPPPPVHIDVNVVATTSGVSRDAMPGDEISDPWTLRPIDFDVQPLVGVAGPSRLAAGMVSINSRNGVASVFEQQNGNGNKLVSKSDTAAKNDADDVLLLDSDEEDNDPTLGWDLRELMQILPNVPGDRLRNSLWKLRHAGDRVTLVINDMLDMEVAPQKTNASVPKTHVAPMANGKDRRQADDGPKAKRLKTNEAVTAEKQGEEHSPAGAHTAIHASNSVEKLPEKQGFIAAEPSTSNGIEAEVIKAKFPASGSTSAAHNSELSAGEKKPDGFRQTNQNGPQESLIAADREAGEKEKSVDTNPDAKNSTRAPAKGKALVKSAIPLLPPMQVPTDASLAPTSDPSDEEDEENLTDAKLGRAKTLYRLITQKFPAIHVLYAANQAAELVEGGWTKEHNKNETVLENISKTGFPKLKDEWFVPKPEPGNEQGAVVTSLRQKLLNKVIEEQVENAVQIFPNIDPEYLEERISAFNGCEPKVQQFIASIVEDPKPHPSVEEYNKRQRCAEIANKVWSAEDFLENYENPLKYFYDPKRSASVSGEMAANYGSQLLAYLRKEFPNFTKQYIQKAIARCGGNAVLAYHTLRKAPVPQSKVVCKPFDLRKAGNITCPRLIEELNFLSVEHEIRAILEERERTRKQALEIARQNKQFLECAICCEDELIEMDFVGCPDKHMFCKPCVGKYVEEIMGMVKCHFPCLNTSCDKEFEPQELKVVLKPQVFKRLMRRIQTEEIACANIDGLEMCPFCDYAAIPPEGDKIFQCLNPECLKKSCRLCQEEAHIPLSCQEFKTSKKLDKMRTYMEDKMTEALLRECPRCKKKFVKIDGCNKIICPCGAVSCYICRKEVKDYTHFDGQGSYTGKCRLWTNTEAMHQQEIRAEAVKARQELEEQNPGVALDEVLPEVPAAPPAPEVQARPPGHPRRHRLVPVRPDGPEPDERLQLLRRDRAAMFMARVAVENIMRQPAGHHRHQPAAQHMHPRAGHHVPPYDPFANLLWGHFMARRARNNIPQPAGQQEPQQVGQQGPHPAGQHEPQVANHDFPQPVDQRGLQPAGHHMHQPAAHHMHRRAAHYMPVFDLPALLMPRRARNNMPQQAGQNGPQPADQQRPQPAAHRMHPRAGHQMPPYDPLVYPPLGQFIPRRARNIMPQQAGQQGLQPAGQQRAQQAGQQGPQPAGRQRAQQAGQHEPQVADQDLNLVNQQRALQHLADEANRAARRLERRNRHENGNE